MLKKFTDGVFDAAFAMRFGMAAAADQPRPLSRRGWVGWLTTDDIDWACEHIERTGGTPAFSRAERFVAKLLGIRPHAAEPERPVMRLVVDDEFVARHRANLERHNQPQSA